jgi:aspartyl-tRNA(Asn)/glutamyl-tRNA(Gln) amidotransferase subunit B
LSKKYEVVIGLEVHVELKTASKIFCGCSTTFGAPPNTQCCPVCLGLPGTLPVLNEKVVEYAVLAGLATNCRITRNGKQDRKNYFYPDLPKAYQISQYDHPLCEEGYVDIEAQDLSKRIGITRIHIEEDAGKLIHDQQGGTLIDYNRCGVALIEIVSEPDIRSAEEAKAYLQKLRAILLYADVSDCKMNEGSFRCDVNLSIREYGAKAFGTRTEMKNLNSFNSINRAIANETQRQIRLLESGGKVVQESRRWDQDKNKSFSMRTKEDAHDYRYFPDPDLMPIIIDEAYIENVREQLPPLPDERKAKYIEHYQLSQYDAEQIVSSRELADFFEETAKSVKSPKIAANIMMTDLMRLISKSDDEDLVIPFSGESFSSLVNLIVNGEINTSIAKKVIEKMWKDGVDPVEMIEKEGLKLIKDEGVLTPIVSEILESHEKVVQDYLSGKEKALQSLIGQVMRKTSGKADPQMTLDLIVKMIKK